jgi:CHAD domain-containing protein
MAVETRQFAIPKDFDTVAALAQAVAPLRLSEADAQHLQHTYYDSFDWRLFAGDTLLLTEKRDGQRHLHWQERQGATSLAAVPLATAPDFVWNLPPGPLRRKLTPLLEMRRLLPQMRLTCRRQGYKLLNDDDKTVLRLYEERGSAVDPRSGRRKPLPRRLRVEALRGYLKPFRRLIRFLEAELQLPALDDDPLSLALHAHGRQGCDYSAKFKVALEPTLRSDAAARRLLLHLLDTLERNEPGTRADLDSEFLHDFRVAGRRSRSALSQIKNVFPQRVVARFRRELAWLNQISGPTRDMDVYLLTFPAYQASLPAEVRQDLEPLRDFLHSQQRTAHQALVRALDSARYRRFKQAWRDYLQSPLPPRTTLANARRPVKAVADQRIWRMFRRIIKEGEAITPQSPPTDLHELRKTCKKLRYLLECFQSLYPAPAMKRIIKALKTLQNNLGDYQDLHIQITALQEFSEQMLAAQQAGAHTLLAMGMLVENLEQRQLQARAAFSARFAEFGAAKNRQLFRRLFAPHETQS